MQNTDLIILFLLLMIALFLLIRHHNIKWERNKPDCFGSLYGPVDYAENDCCTCQYCRKCHGMKYKGRDI